MPKEDGQKPAPSALQNEYRQIESEYKRDVAILEARPLVERWAFILWGMLDVALLVVFLIAVPAYIVSGSFTDIRQAAGILENAAARHALVAAQAPESLIPGTARALSGETGTTDFVADLENPNAEWYATFSYVFSYDGGETPSTAGFINPGETLPFVALHVKTDGIGRNPSLLIRDIVWQRVDRHRIQDTTEFLHERDDFPVSNVSTVGDIVVGSSALPHTDFTILNNTAYSYWNPLFIILLTRGNTPVAAQQVLVPELMAGESRPVSVRWFQPVPSGTTVKIVPVINFFDESVYMKPVGE